MFSYTATFHIHELKDQEINIRYNGNHYKQGTWLKPHFEIADKADLSLQYHQDLYHLQHGYQKYWMFFGSLNMCFIVLASILICVILAEMISKVASFIILLVLIIMFVIFILNDYRIYKDYKYHRTLVQVDGEKKQVYTQSFE